MGKYFVKHIVAAGLLCFLCLGCRSSRAPEVLSEVLPAVPDYSDTTQWYTVDRQAAVDLFYVVSTETGDYTVDGHPCHYADTYSDSLRTFLLGEMKGVDDLLSGGLNYFSPYYRQCTASPLPWTTCAGLSPTIFPGSITVALLSWLGLARVAPLSSSYSR